MAVMNQPRTPLGKTVNRTLKTATHLKNVPNMPEGSYVITQFDTEFEKKKNMLETVTLMKEADSVWRVTGFLHTVTVSVHDFA